MSGRRVGLRIILPLALAAAACGGPEETVVKQYFGAVAAQDNQTLSSFAVVRFEKKVRQWEITGVQPESKSPAPLPELVKKHKDLEAQLEANKKQASGYALDHLAQVEQVRDLHKKNAKIPAKLQPVADEWEKFNAKDRELKKAVAEAKEAVEREKRNVTLSLGQLDDIENLGGELITKQVDLNLTIENEGPQDYVMTLRKYQVVPTSGQRVLSRWVVEKLTPKS